MTNIKTLEDLYKAVKDLYKSHPKDTPVEGYNDMDGIPFVDIYFREEEIYPDETIPAVVTVSVTF